MSSFTSLFRFRDDQGSIYYGEAGTPNAPTKENLTGRDVQVFTGGDPWDDGFSLSNDRRRVAEVLCPLPSTPIFLCVGLNYKQHANEAKMAYGEYPIIFTKPPGTGILIESKGERAGISRWTDALAGPYEDIPINPICLNMDYEAELCVVIGKDCKSLTTSDDLSDIILGYTAGNDVSSRYWQAPERSGNQHGGAKSFDKFAPIGPVIVSSREIPDPKLLQMETFVNGEKRQSTKIDDLIFDIPRILRHLSRGTTLRKGTVVMTGTPSGVAAFMKPPAWLKDGDMVEIKVEKIGSIANRMVFEKASRDNNA